MLDLKDPSLLKQAIFINGAWSVPQACDWIEVGNPSTGELVGRVPKAGRKEAVEAIEGAENAFRAWAARPAVERARVVKRWYDLIVENADDLALILTAEQGKPLAEAKGESLYGAAFFEWFAEEAKRVYGEVLPAAQP